MSKSKKILKIALATALAATSLKLAKDAFVKTKRRYTRDEEISKNEEIKKYNTFFDRRLVEVPRGDFYGCEIKTVASKFVLDLSRTNIENDIYISFNSRLSFTTIILPSYVRAKVDIYKKCTKVLNYSEFTDKKLPTVYIIGKALKSSLEIVPEGIYLDDEFEDEEIGEFFDSKE